MSLLVLLTLGAATGWLAAVLMRQDTFSQSLTNIALGALGSLGSTLVTGKPADSASISVESLVFGVLGAAIFLALATVFRRQMVR